MISSFRVASWLTGNFSISNASCGNISNIPLTFTGTNSSSYLLESILVGKSPTPFLMSGHTHWSKYGGTPPHLEIVKACDQCHVPDDVHLSPLPARADMYSGFNIPAGSTVLSLDHLRAISFPLHPMIHLILFFTNICN